MFNPAAYLTHLIATLKAHIFAHAPAVAPVRAPMFHHLYNYLARTNARFLRLYTLWQQNRLPPPRPRAPVSGSQPESHADPLAESGPSPRRHPAHPRFSRSRGWLTRDLGRPAAAANGLLSHLLAQPECAAFLREVPRAGRLLRPLLRMLNTDPLPPLLALPPRPRNPAAPPRWPRGLRRPSTHPYPMLPDDKPLRGYVLRAARAWKKPRS